MEYAVRVTTVVLPGSRIEIVVPEFQEGDQVELFLFRRESNEAEPRSIFEIIESLKGHRLFQTPEEVDRYLDEERNSWDR